ncbi:MAG: hypothetical protein AB7V16_11420 [Vulcanibacillus sp.]
MNRSKSHKIYIAKYIFGSVKGLTFNLKNLKYAVENELIIKDISLNGFKFIEIKDNFIYCCSVKMNNNYLVDHVLSVHDFWKLTKNRKKDIIILFKNN